MSLCWPERPRRGSFVELRCFLLNVRCSRLQQAACLLITLGDCTAVGDNIIMQHVFWLLQAEQAAAARVSADDVVAARQAADALWSWREGSSASAAQMAQMLFSGSLQVWRLCCLETQLGWCPASFKKLCCSTIQGISRFVQAHRGQPSTQA